MFDWSTVRALMALRLHHKERWLSFCGRVWINGGANHGQGQGQGQGREGRERDMQTKRGKDEPELDRASHVALNGVLEVHDSSPIE